jgi:hypothetical protein
VTSAARRPRLIVVAFAVFTLLAVLALTPSAKAGLIGTAPAFGCDEPSQVFAPWGDDAYYGLVPGGTFEADAAPWSLSGGARTVSGNEPFHVNSPADSRSLYLPSGSSALSPTVCFGFGDWHGRFFVRNVGSTRGSLKVDVAVRSVLGLVSLLDGGTIGATGEWQPSPRIRLTLTNVCSLLGVRSIAFRLRPIGAGAAFQVDDVYLDPYKEW